MATRQVGVCQGAGVPLLAGIVTSSDAHLNTHTHPLRLAALRTPALEIIALCVVR